MHARGDGSFGRSAGTQTLKGAGLLAIAVVIGIILLHTAPSSITTVSASTGVTPTTKAPRPRTTTRTTVTQPPLVTTTTAPQPHPPAQVKVAVANGSGVQGLAGRLRLQLSSVGYNTSIPALNAPATVPATTVYYVAGYLPDATVIATGQLSLPASVVKPMPSPAPVPQALTQGAEVLVVAGADIGGITTNTTEAPAGNTIAPTTKAPTTTTPHTATTTRTTVAVHPATTVKLG